MLKKIASLTPLLLLSGCALINSDEYSKKTIDAMSESEQKLSSQLQEINLNLSNQTDYIESLEASIINLSNEVEKLKKNQRHIRTVTVPAKNPAPNTPNPTLLASTVPDLKAGMVALGSLEYLYIDVIKSEFTARIDTGATTSSINAADMQEFDRNGKRWVRFHVLDDNDPEARKWVEAPIIRHVKIRQSTEDKKLERRAVVELWIKIGSIHEKAQFTLADRSQMDYPILLGREFIQDIAVVDVSRKFIQKPQKKSDIK